MLFKFEFEQNMGLCRAVSIKDARSYMIRQLGRDREPRITIATDEDEGWFDMMSGGGFVYETQQHWTRERKKHGRR